MYPTSIDLADNVRKSSIALLQARLSDSVDLGTQAKQAHWNVKGPNFVALHGLFDSIANEADEWTDTIAERLVSLGAVAEGTARVASDRSRLPLYPLWASTGTEHVKALSKSLATYGKLVRANIDETADAGDAVTADLFTSVSRAVDKNLWMVEAHAHATS